MDARNPSNSCNFIPPQWSRTHPLPDRNESMLGQPH